MLKKWLSQWRGRADQTDDEDTKRGWGIATAEDNGRPLIIRFRNTPPKGVEPSAYPHLIAVHWSFEAESGMPSDVEKLRMREFEETLVGTFEPIAQAFMTVVVTGNEVCEWQWYAHSEADFMEILNDVLADRPPYPIRIAVELDPEWSAYRRIVGS